jgi:GAF domain-containing protein
MSTTAERLHLLCEVTRRLATFTDLPELLRYATRRTQEVFGAEGCALLLLDRARHEFYFPVASQEASRRSAEARLTEIRFSAQRGIAGWVLARGEAVLVADARNDTRFYGGVDHLTGMTTHALLCAPLRTSGGNIGVIEVVNPSPGSMTTNDLEFLEALASDISVAHERVLLYERLRGEVASLRQVSSLAGLLVLAAGLLAAGAAAVGHLAWALPLRELPTRPGMVTGMIGVLVGALLLAVGRGWLVGRTTVPGQAQGANSALRS